MKKACLKLISLIGMMTHCKSQVCPSAGLPNDVFTLAWIDDNRFPSCGYRPVKSECIVTSNQLTAFGQPWWGYHCYWDAAANRCRLDDGCCNRWTDEYILGGNEYRRKLIERMGCKPYYVKKLDLPCEAGVANWEWADKENKKRCHHQCKATGGCSGLECFTQTLSAVIEFSPVGFAVKNLADIATHASKA